MESIGIYVKSINQLKKIRSYLKQPDIKKITINFSIMDSETSGELRSCIYSIIKDQNINDKIKKQLYSDIFTIDFDKIYPEQKYSNNNSNEILKMFIIDYCTSRISKLGTIIGSDTTSAY